jgi:hypothetical protein
MFNLETLQDAGKWGEMKSSLLEGLNSNQKNIVGRVLENQKQQLINETASAGSVSANDIANFRKAVLPMIRRIIPGTIGTELVGVQPMSGPVGLIYTLRYKYQEPMTHNDTNSAFGGYDINAGDEAFGNLKPIRQFYSGNTGAAQGAGASGLGSSQYQLNNIDQATAQGNAWPSTEDSTTYKTGTENYGPYSVPIGGTLLGGSGSFLEGSGGRKMTLEVISQAAEAGSRKLQAGWTIEAMQDLNSQHGLDLESELTKALSAEIVQEIDAEIINDLLGLAGTVRVFDFAQTGFGGGTGQYAPTFVGDRFANIGVRINEVANEIGRKTRRGVGNFIVVSPMIVSVLQSAAKSVFAPAVEGSFKGPNNTMLVGTLNGTIKVYSYIWNQAQSLGYSSPSPTPPPFGANFQNGSQAVPPLGAGTDLILVGYKGGNGETDAGYFYCPYIPLMSTGTVVNPVTFQPVISLMTRYAKVAFTDPTISLGNSADYYGKITVRNLDFI